MLCAHPAVAAAAVVGLPHERLGEQVGVGGGKLPLRAGGLRAERVEAVGVQRVQRVHATCLKVLAMHTAPTCWALQHVKADVPIYIQARTVASARGP